MKVVRRDIVPNGPGSMIPVDSDDLWFAYNLIAVGDSVMARTVRKVLRETSGGRDAERVTLKLEIRVESIDYDKEGSVLRIRGKNILENEHVKIGAFHTLELELQRPFVLRKVSLNSVGKLLFWGLAMYLKLFTFICAAVPVILVFPYSQKIIDMK
ncbi:Translation release factor pelota-like protein [Corchorus olitorius]|uniref:Translation release factor pelota-like protein n=1 Tax=Corchorus olitorius TaxID=93759 RepID=A0A1R3KMC2_9ROSI|nr:Translation release factor pelota-like protein [Corchorus olitorius]